ncbi:MAG TPA: amidase [Alphaproteobacteria bacterium]
MRDFLGAFCDFHDVSIKGHRGGPLAGLTFGVKDVFDIAGHRTGAGNPDYLRDAALAGSTAPPVQALLDAGADLVGKTHCDEMCFGVEGENHFYGTPENVNAPGRIPGGSSSGSAAAVAGKLVDFAIGTDTGGSVRLPASFCGIYGLRPSHGRITTAGLVPLAPSTDTVGWFARDAGTMERVGRVLFGEDPIEFVPRRLFQAAEVMALAEPDVMAAIRPAVERLASRLGAAQTVDVCPDGMSEWVSCLRTIQAIETWRCNAPWITEKQPTFGPRVAARFEWTRTVDPSLEGAARERRQRYRTALQDLLGGDGLIVVPTGPCIAPRRNSPDIDDMRMRALTMLSIAGVTGAPQISLPLATSQGCPVGVSLIGPPGADRALLLFAAALDWG